jgi:hypothetical protein
MKTAFHVGATTVFVLCVICGSRASAQSAAEIDSRMNPIRQMISQIDKDRDEFDSKGRELGAQYGTDRQYEPAEIHEMVSNGRRKLRLVQEYNDVISGYSAKCVLMLTQYPELATHLAKFRSAMDSVHQSQMALAAGNEQALAIYLQLQQAYRNKDADRWNTLVDQSAGLAAKNKELGDQGRLMVAYAERMMSDAQAALRAMLDSLQNDLSRARNDGTRSSNVHGSGANLTVDTRGLSALTSAIQKASKAPGCTGNGMCNFFVGKVAELTCVPYFNGILTPQSPDGRTANKIYSFIEKAGQSKPSGWKVLPEQEVQDAANSGKFVIGVARNVTPSAHNHGHVVIVAPSGVDQLPHGADTGSGPWVRDSRHANKSVRSSYSFCPQGSECSRKSPQDVTVKPVYAVWEYPIKGCTAAN